MRKTPRSTSRKALVLGLGALGLAGTLTAAALLAEGPRAASTSARTPADDEVLAKVDARDRAGARAAGQLAAGDVRARVELARRFLERAHQSSDPRHLGRAQAALAPWMGLGEVPDEVRLLRAQLAQSLHDFAAARADLDYLATAYPEDPSVQLGRAAVATVTADYPAALQSCAALAATADRLTTAACKAPVALVRGQAQAALRELTVEAALHPPRSPRLAAWIATLQGELAAALDQVELAERHLRAALALAPDTYTKTALADLYLTHGRPADALALIDGEPTADRADRAREIDGLLLRAAIAEKRLGAPTAAASAAALRERLAATEARGDLTHRREQGLFELDVEERPAEALALLIANWQLQKEPIDALLLLRAAAAAGRPEAAAPVLQWIHLHGVDDRAIARAVAALPTRGATP